MSADDVCDLLCLDLPHAERIRAGLPDLARMEPAAGIARGLGDPTRLRIAATLLTGEELCVCDTAWIVGASQGLVSHHLRLLRTAGVVTSRKDGRMVMYRLSGPGRAVLTVLLEPDSAPASSEPDANDALEGVDRG